ncbi:MAG: prephenate dehydrogenase [Spirochaetaceae bacterium]|jgi:prephenate dehydrogenase|nr:prephenate dehydrogenase [Spirochaetaceae bacterium]
MKPIEECTLGIVGLGLMGGAIAMALRGEGLIPRGGPGRILGCDPDPASLAAARSDAVIDEGFTTPEPLLKQCDMVFLCISPAILREFMEQWMDAFRPGALITDIAGIKGKIAAAMERGLRADLDFIPGHPMAGSEKGGYSSAKNCDFHGKNYILTPLKRNKAENLDFLKKLIYRMGFGRITCTTAEEHDRKIAFTSQLCHVIAAALIDCEDDREITRFGGGSFEDLTRIAMLNVPLWTELFQENQEALIERIVQFEESLDKIKGFIAAGRRDALEQTLQTVRDRRAAMK